MAAPPDGHPEIDWNKWEPAGPGDVRSPCPMMNSLANHHILPHNGKGITKEMAIKALTSSVKFDSFISTTFTLGALLSNPDHRSHMFDLDMVDKHGLIEHDVSLSRDDFALGDNHTFNKEIFETVLSTYGDAKETSFETASKARWERLMACKKAHEDAGKPFVYGIREFICSYGETALFTSVLGDKKAGTCPIEYLRIFFEEERLPYKEGWRPPTAEITQSDMNHLIYNLVEHNAQKSTEINDVGLDTIHAFEAAVTSFLPRHCTIM